MSFAAAHEFKKVHQICVVRSKDEARQYEDDRIRPPGATKNYLTLNDFDKHKSCNRAPRSGISTSANGIAKTNSKTRVSTSAGRVDRDFRGFEMPSGTKTKRPELRAYGRGRRKMRPWIGVAVYVTDIAGDVDVEWDVKWVDVYLPGCGTWYAAGTRCVKNAGYQPDLLGADEPGSPIQPNFSRGCFE